MASLNKKPVSINTHEGARAHHINAEQQLRRSVMACMLWEKQFYEDGQEIAERIKSLVAQVDPEKIEQIAIDARVKMKLRHVPLLIAREMARLPEHRKYVAGALMQIIQRADELTEFLSIYWSEKKQPLSSQVKKGLAGAFCKFDAYQLAKYNRDNAIKLRDVLFLCHAKAKDADQEAVWKKLIDGTLESPDTWEVALSLGGDKKEHWTRLLTENKLGALALLRNLRNMKEAFVDESIIRKALAKMKAERVLPFRFIAAARYAPQWEPELEASMFKCLAEHEKLPGKTVLLVDVSGSMHNPVSTNSDITRLDAACGVAMLAREICDSGEMFTFSNKITQVPMRRGFALRDAIVNSQPHSGTYLGQAVHAIIERVPCDRLIVITDEQSHDAVPAPNNKGYMINVASYRNGVGYGSWMHIDGWSEAVIDYINEHEKANEAR